jgi:NADP-dependent 3-hydroxy acid dehydrogenase YdfG
MTSFPGWGQEDRVTVISGATGYLGRSLTRGFADAGSKLILTARDQEALDKLADEVGVGPDRVHAFAADLTDSAAGERIVGQALVNGGRIETVCLPASPIMNCLRYTKLTCGAHCARCGRL